MTPFGAYLRTLRTARGLTQMAFAAKLDVSAAYVSALEHGHRGAPSIGLVHQVCDVLGLAWEEADELNRLSRLSHPRVMLRTAGLTPEQTALANRIARGLADLPPETVASMHALLDAVPPRPRRG